ncbi:MAG: hypothetical protein Q8R13_01580 [bacterium]|nr:hypothetical protein [bacterium]
MRDPTKPPTHWENALETPQQRAGFQALLEQAAIKREVGGETIREISNLHAAARSMGMPEDFFSRDPIAYFIVHTEGRPSIRTAARYRIFEDIEEARRFRITQYRDRLEAAELEALQAQRLGSATLNMLDVVLTLPLPLKEAIPVFRQAYLDTVLTLSGNNATEAQRMCLISRPHFYRQRSAKKLKKGRARR